MKGLKILVIGLICLLTLGIIAGTTLAILYFSCQPVRHWLNTPTRNEMKSYFADESNFIQTEGKVLQVKAKDGFLSLEINLTNNYQSILEQNRAQTNQWFRTFGPIDGEINEGDHVVLITAPRRFWNTYRLPIVYLRINNTVLLELDVGKQTLMDWVEGY